MPCVQPRTGKELIQSVLYYIDGMKQLAATLNDRRAVLHFDECRAEVWRAYYGGYSLPVRQEVKGPHYLTAPVPASKPPWMIAKYARPMRKVVGRVAESVCYSRRAPAVRVSWDILECGHKVEGNETYGAAAPARHRRCGECEPAGVGANDQPERAANYSQERSNKLG